MKLFFSILIFTASSALAVSYDVGSKSIKDLNFEKLVNLSQASEKPYSVEKSLAQLQTYYPDIFDSYILMHRSRSLQQSSFLNPRVLLIGYESRFVITYNGDPNHSGYNSLETMEFDEQDSTFTFREILFNDGEIKVSEDNPQKCLNCHQSASRTDINPRPNWEPYNLWPGAYGMVGHGSDFLRKYTGVFDPFLFSEFEQEEQRYKEFSEYSKRHSRYKFLKALKPDKKGKYFNTSIDYRPARMPTNFTESLGILNSKRLYQTIKNHPHTKNVENAFWLYNNCFENIKFPDKIFNWLQDQVPEVQLKKNPKNLSEILDILFTPFGIDTSDWSMDFQTAGKFSMRKNGRFTTPGSSSVTYLLKQQYKKEHPEGINCDEQAKKALEEISVFNLKDLENIKNKFAVTPQPLINQCATCHSTFLTAPYIPFNDELALKSALQESGFTRGTLLDEILFRIGPHATSIERMPANGYLPKESEVEILKKYLLEL